MQGIYIEDKVSIWLTTQQLNNYSNIINTILLRHMRARCYTETYGVDRYKARLVVKRYTQTYDVNYFETFSLFAQLNSI